MITDRPWFGSPDWKKLPIGNVSIDELPPTVVDFTLLTQPSRGSVRDRSFPSEELRGFYKVGLPSFLEKMVLHQICTFRLCNVLICRGRWQRVAQENWLI